MPRKDPDKRSADAKARYIAHREERLAYQESYREQNRKQIRAQDRTAYWKNVEEERARSRRFYAKNRKRMIEKALLRTQRVKKEDPEQFRKMERDYRKQQYAKDPDKGITKTRIRRTRKRNLPDTFTPAQKTFMLAYWHHACAICGNQRGFFWTVADDHFIPLSSPECPGTIASNMIPLCDGQGGCNTKKGKKAMKPWLVKQVGPRKATKILQAIATYFAAVQTMFPTP